MQASGPPETMTLIHPNTHPFILHATWQKRSENGQKCGHDFADHAQSTHQPDSDQRTMFKQDTPHIKKKGPISRLMSVWLRSIREFMRATSSRPAPERVSPLFTWRYLPNVRFVSITKPRWTGLQHLILQQPFRQFKYILSLHCSDKDQNTNSFP